MQAPKEAGPWQHSSRGARSSSLPQGLARVGELYNPSAVQMQQLSARSHSAQEAQPVSIPLGTKFSSACLQHA